MMPPIPRHIIFKHEDDIRGELSGDGADSNSKPTPPHNLPLVDEIDLQQCLISPSQPWRASEIQGVVIGKEHLEVICKAAGAGTIGGAGGSYPGVGVGNGFQACPCCRRFIQQNSHGDIESGDDAAMKSPPTSAVIASRPEEEGATLTSLVQAAVTTLTTQPSIMQPMGAPPLVAGDRLKNYTVVETIVQGWLYKKGTGGDWAGRRWWKPRWVTLALAEDPSTVVPKPILISHRAPGVPYPASAIELTESTVIMAIERMRGETSSDGKEQARHSHAPTKAEWNRHCLQIVHTQHQDNKTTPQTTTRIFTAPAEDRNEWSFAINKAILAYEKRLGRARSDAANHEYRAAMQARKSRRLGGSGSPELRRELEGEKREEQREPDRSGMRSHSPLHVMGLPPTAPRRRLVRSPSPIRPVRPMNWRRTITP